MIRTQVQLTEEQAAKLRRVAADRGVSLAEVIRDAVDRIQDPDSTSQRWARALAVARRGYRDVEGATDVSERHDEYVAEALAKDLRRT